MVDVKVLDTKLRVIAGFMLWISVDANYTRRPVLKRSKSEVFIFCKKIDDWFIENNIEYKLFWIDYDYTGITFEKESDAILFKLTWG